VPPGRATTEGTYALKVVLDPMSMLAVEFTVTKIPESYKIKL